MKIDITADIEKIEKVFDRLDARLAGTDARMQGTAKSVSAAASRGSGGRSGGSARRVTAAQVVNQMGADGALAAYSSDALAGSPFAAQIVNAAVRQKNAISRARRALAPPVQRDPVQQALARTRFVQIGSQMIGMPLGRDLPMVGHLMGSVMRGGGAGKAAGAATGMAGMAKFGQVGLLAAGATALVMAFKKGADTLNETRKNWVRLGGTPGQAAAASRLEKFTGANATGLFQGIGSGGLSAAIASQMGINPVRGFFGEINDSKDFIRILDRLRAMPYEQSRRMAYGLGDPNLSNVNLLSDMTYNRLKANTSAGNSQFNMRNSAEFDASMTIITDSLDRAFKTLAGPPLRIAAMHIQMFSDVVSTLTNFSGLNMLTDLIDRMSKIVNGGRGTAIEDNTRAIQDNTKTMKDGIAGGGPRTQGAVPRGWMGNPSEGMADARARANLGIA